jgi:hypothetical protein
VTTYSYIFQVDGRETWVRTFSFASDEAAIEEGAELIGSQARLRPSASLALRVGRGPESNPEWLGVWSWNGQPHWKPQA